MAYDEEMTEKVLELLLEDSRRSQREMAAKLNVSPTTIGKIVKSLEDDGILMNYTIMVDWAKFGYDSVMCLQLAVSPSADVQEVGKTLRENTAIKQVFYIMGDMTFACYAVCRDKNESAEIMKEIGKIEGVEKLVCHAVLKQF